MIDEDAMNDGRLRLGDDDEELDSNDEDDENSDVDDSMSGKGDDGGGSESYIDIMEKFIYTFRNGDYDEEFDDALYLDQSVTLLVRPTQASYNKTDNWRERNRIGLEKMKVQLKTCIDSVSLELKLEHNGYGDRLMDNEEPIVWHEPILDEYWNRLEEKRELVIRDILIENVEMKKERIDALVSILISGRANSLSKHVMFCNANICEEGIISISKLVDVSSKLYQIIITHNRIDNMDSARCLSRSLKSHACINQLNLAHCDLGSRPEILLVILQSDISIICLGSNNIDSFGAIKIAEYLEGDSSPIVSINLDRNCLNDDDAILISRALKRNTKLRQLGLHSNNFTSIGMKALLTCVFDSSSLNALSESNHTLREIRFFDDINSERFDGCIDRLLQFDQTQKILLALKDKDTLLQYLTNIPVKLMPEVLAFSQRDDYQRSRRNLSIVYSTMRWWNMPLLYSYYCCTKSDSKRKRND
jgi:hypothetical protein